MKGKSKSKVISIVPFDISRLQDSLEAASLIYQLEPKFSPLLLLENRITDGERRRKQRNAQTLVDSAREHFNLSGEGSGLGLILTNFDLFAKEMNYVFGFANPEDGIAIVSTARLAQWEEGINASRINERVMKEAAHEIGHLARLVHCENVLCLMSYASDLMRVDEKLPLLCSNCERKLKFDGRG